MTSGGTHLGMGRLVVASLRAHATRLVSTTLAIVLGVAFLSGTLVVGETMRSAYRGMFATSFEGTDVVVQSATIETDTVIERRVLDAGLLDDVAAVDGVDRAEPVIEGYGRLVGADGEPVGSFGPPTIAGNWVDDPDLNPYRLAEGRPPQAPDEVVVNRGAADDGGLSVGDRTTVQVPEPIEVEVVGLSTFGDLDSSGGITFTAFHLESARAILLDGGSGMTSIAVAASPGTDADGLAAAIAPLLPEGVEAVTGRDLADDRTQALEDDFLGFLTTFLVVIAGVALLVASFSIHNTFAIVAAQRSSETALLRAIGAARRQVLGAAAAEALTLGVVASAVGVVAGLAIATGLLALFDAVAADVPADGLVVDPGPLVASFAVGVLVTLAAAVVPAWRSSRVPPIAALRSVAVEASGSSRRRVVAGALVTALGVGLVVLGVGADDGLAAAGAGAVATLSGMVILGPVAARPAAAVLGAPVAATRGVVGTLARDNASRNPRRTASSAAALMVGVGVVTLFTVMAASVKASLDESLTGSLRGDLVVTAGPMGMGGFDDGVAGEVAALPEVSAALGLGSSAALVDGVAEGVTAIDPRGVDDLLDLDVTEGSLAELTEGSVAVSASKADGEGWSIGSPVPIRLADGTATSLEVAAVYERADLVGDVVVAREALPSGTRALDAVILVALVDDTTTDEGALAVTGVVERYGGAEVDDRDTFVDTMAGSVDQALGLVYVLLVLAIVIALMGIANTLALSVHERTRELGLLRAVGQTRRQTRSMVRWESVLIAVFGAAGGIAIGTFLGWALVTAAASEGIGTFAVPAGQVLTVLLVGAAAGVVAALRPARRAARLDVLTAIATE